MSLDRNLEILKIYADWVKHAEVKLNYIFVVVIGLITLQFRLFDKYISQIRCEALGWLATVLLMVAIGFSIYAFGSIINGLSPRMYKNSGNHTTNLYYYGDFDKDDFYNKLISNDADRDTMVANQIQAIGRIVTKKFNKSRTAAFCIKWSSFLALLVMAIYIIDKGM